MPLNIQRNTLFWYLLVAAIVLIIVVLINYGAGEILSVKPLPSSSTASTTSTASSRPPKGGGEPSSSVPATFSSSTSSSSYSSADSSAPPASSLSSAASSAVTVGCAQLPITGNVPLFELAGFYSGFLGGLYPGGSNLPPASHQAAAEQLALQIQPLNAQGQPDPLGKIVLASIGMSNASYEFTDFVSDLPSNLAINPRVLVVNGAQPKKTADIWANPSGDAWGVLAQRIANAAVTTQQVQIVWLKNAELGPSQYGAFPAHAEVLRGHLENILRNVHTFYPNVKIVYFTSRTRAHTNVPDSLNPEPYAYESGFAFRWVIEDQVSGQGNINYDPNAGPVVAPFVLWGPYVWSDGDIVRSDGFVWPYADLTSDCVHPSNTGIQKIGDKLMSFFTTNETTSGWFLDSTKNQFQVSLLADTTQGTAPFAVNFSAAIVGGPPPSGQPKYFWNFGDGGLANGFNKTQALKSFFVPGTYPVRVTATDGNGIYGTGLINIVVQ